MLSPFLYRASVLSAASLAIAINSLWCCCRMARQPTVCVFLSALFSLLLHFSALQFSKKKKKSIVHIFGSGVSCRYCIKTNRRSVFQLVSCPSLFRACSFLTADSISQPSFIKARFRWLWHPHIVGHSLLTVSKPVSHCFGVVKWTGFLRSSNTCVPHKFMPDSCLLAAVCSSVVSCLRGHIQCP